MADEKKALILTNNSGVVQTFGSIFTDLGYQPENQRFRDMKNGSDAAEKALAEGISAIYLHRHCTIMDRSSHLSLEIMKALRDEYQGIFLIGSNSDLSVAEKRYVKSNPCYGLCELPTNLDKIKAQLQGLERHLR
jgi:hypothetical protein